ncbi:MAG: filamentous hemagglutinin N-terminal domain-containing protein, partial [Selenomonadaceae bacterium]|nr:filamentous hemagglutinin N-terminal domain-containing protein [Selenomonadaceae bacterium]
MKRLQHTIALTLSIVGGLYHMAWAAPAPTELPTKEQDMKNATVARDETKPVMTIEQTKGQNRAFISWDTFNIGKDATVNVKQYSGADLLVNAVRGNNMSEIAGKLNATGNVAL